MNSSVSSWTTMNSDVSVDLYAVWGTSASNIYAVGENGTIVHYDGSGWVQQSSGTSQTLLTIWGKNPNNIYVAGRQGTLLHYNGTAWTNITTGTYYDLVGISGTDGSPVYLVASNGDLYTIQASSVELYKQKFYFVPNAIWGCNDRLHPFTTHPTNNFITVGGNASVGIFANDTIQVIKFYPSIFYDIHGTSWNNVFAVGTTNRIVYMNGFKGTILKYNNIQSNFLYGVWTIGTKEAIIVAAGGDIYHINDNSSQKMESGTNNTLRDIWGSSSDDLYVVGDNGTILHSK